MLDSVELERLRRQRICRHKIGIITITGFDKEEKLFHYEGFRDCDCYEPVEEHQLFVLKKRKSSIRGEGINIGTAR